MKIFPLLFLLLICLEIIAQPASEKKAFTGKNNLGSLGTEIPIGDFSNTHLPGIGMEYSRSKNRFGILSAADTKKIAFVYGGGIAMYFGKKETISGYTYKYPAYIFIKTTVGILYKPSSKSGFTFTAGPAIGIYNGNTQFNLNSKLEGHYFLNEKLAITPGIILLKEMTVADPLIAVSLKASLAF